MRISDWSSGVGSSDLRPAARCRRAAEAESDGLFGQKARLSGAPVGEPPAGHADRDRARQRVDSRSGILKRGAHDLGGIDRSEEHTSELQSLMRISYAVFCLKKKNTYAAITLHQ